MMSTNQDQIFPTTFLICLNKIILNHIFLPSTKVDLVMFSSLGSVASLCLISEDKIQTPLIKLGTPSPSLSTHKDSRTLSVEAHIRMINKIINLSTRHQYLSHNCLRHKLIPAEIPQSKCLLTLCSSSATLYKVHCKRARPSHFVVK